MTPPGYEFCEAKTALIILGSDLALVYTPTAIKVLYNTRHGLFTCLFVYCAGVQPQATPGRRCPGPL